MNKIKPLSVKYFRPSLSVFVPLMACLSLNTVAAPGELATQPLTFVVSPQPNIMLLLDDSGTMEFSRMISTEGQNETGFDADGEGSEIAADRIFSDIQLLELCAGYNVLAYNPNINYVPWQSISDTSDVASPYIFTNKTLTTARKDPLDDSYANLVDLSDFIYIEWVDTSGDGTVALEWDTDEGQLISGECGPGVGSYDNVALNTIAMPQSGTDSEDRKSGIVTDSNVNNGNYDDTDAGTLVIDVAGGDASDVITFEVNFFNVDRSGSDTDSLTVYGGDVASPIANSITVTELFDSSGNAKVVPDPYETPNSSSAAVTTSTLVLNDSSANNRNNEIKQFTVQGSKATLVFDGGSNIYERAGFSIAWVHTDADADDSGDGILTKDDCRSEEILNGSSLRCVWVGSLPLTEEGAIERNIDQPYNTQENYANWYTYYRTRDSVAKQALGQLVKNSDYRVGLATVNDRGNGGVIAKDMSTTSDKYNSDTFVHEDKDYLLQQIYQVNTADSKKSSANDGTNLRQLLYDAGLYFFEDTAAAGFLGTDIAGNAVSVKHSDESGGDLSIPDPKVLDIDTPLFSSAYGGQCQQNFSLLVTDGSWNGAFDISDAGNPDNIPSETNVDADTIDSIYDGGSYADLNDNTLADVAMLFFKEDLSDTLDDELSLTIHDQKISHQHMVTFSVGFGLTGSLGDNVDPFEVAVWPAVVGADAEKHKIDDLLHASHNGRGGYFSASDPAALQTSLDTIINDINVRTNNTATGSAFSSYELNDEAIKFNVVYHADGWWGDIVAFEYDEANSEFHDTAQWSANGRMSDSSRRANRKIITFNGKEGIVFQAPDTYKTLLNETIDNDNKATLSSEQINDLLENAPHLQSVTEATEIAENDAYLNNLIDYLRGDSTHDGSLFRDRDGHYLGALIHSQPYYVGSPDEYYPDDIESTLYSTYVTEKKYRRPIVYVGGNDGMLHAFYTSTTYESSDGGYTLDIINKGGDELFAYIPHIVSDERLGGKQLSTLANTEYESTPYVDGDIAVADVFVNNKHDIDAAWRTYLVGGLRAGGKGIYVLDVSDPDILSDAEANADSIVVREFTHDDLHYVYGKPVIAKMNNGRWAAIVPSGYATSGVSEINSGSGVAKLFVIYLDRPSSALDLTDSNLDGIYNNGQSDFSIISLGDDNSIWPTLATCDEGDSCALGELASVRARYQHESDTVANEDMFKVKVFSSTFRCEEGEENDQLESVSNYDLVGCYVSQESFNGLSEPAVIDNTADWIADRAYVGDLLGNLWAIDLSSDNPSLWGVEDNNADGHDPLFIATTCSVTAVDDSCDAENVVPQPITSAPTVRSHPDKYVSTTAPNLLVLFGTGQYITEADQQSITRQSYYGLWDAGKYHRSLSKDRLQGQTLTDVFDADGGLLGRTSSSSTVNYSVDAPINYGWYIDYPHTQEDDPDLAGSQIEYKERTVIESVVLGNALVFASFIPNEGTCNASSGASYVYAVEITTGAALGYDFFGVDGVSGVFTDGMILDLEILRSGDDEDVAWFDDAGNQNVNEDEDENDDGDGDGGGDGGGNGGGDGGGDGDSLSEGRQSWSILH